MYMCTYIYTYIYEYLHDCLKYINLHTCTTPGLPQVFPYIFTASRPEHVPCELDC